ncbi:MAG TPA: alkaline phosphatase family protein [Vicinamibacteria bacterium]|nr:alkaline phosphatase family protein [Vicinamibacteria bacterium]
MLSRVRSVPRAAFAGAAALALAAVALAACGPPSTAKPVRRAGQRVFVLGFDGMDPTLARKWMDEGKLPNLRRLAEQGTFAKLETTQPSESPVAWASFATGVNPGRHNIYDFLVRDFDTYMPDLAGVKKEPPVFKWGFLPVKKPRVVSTRGGTSFWVHAGNDGVRSVVLTVPMTFPLEHVEHGQVLGGLPVPDIRGTIGTFNYWATDLSSFEEGNTEMGGYLKRLLFDGGVARPLLKGPDNPILRQEEQELRAKQAAGGLSDDDRQRLDEIAAGKAVDVPFTVKWTEGSGQAEIELQGTTVRLKTGEWSDWVPVAFTFNFLAKARGMTQFHVVQADRELQLYASPVNLDPRDPPIPISSPEKFSRTLADQIGLYRTIGWAEATWPLNEGRLDESTFMYDAERAMEDRERIFFKNLENDDWDLFVAAIETTDRVSHMMWRLIDPRHAMYDAALAARHGDAIEKIYRRADDLVGRIQARLPAGTALFVMSDHGFHSFRRSVNLNTWLVQNGYMVFHGQEGEKKGLADLFGRGKFWEGVDWSRTRAYALGLGQIYFNLRGRESQGIVSAGAEYRALREEIASRLVQLQDPDTGEAVMAAVYKRDDIYQGDYIQNAPDLQVGFNDGYRVGWQDTLGQINRTVVENNNRKWSGDHCATATEISGGVLFANRKIGTTSPHIMDLSPTVLKLLEVPIPSGLDGKPLI